MAIQLQSHLNTGGDRRYMPPQALIDAVSYAIDRTYGAGYSFELRSGVANAARDPHNPATASGRHLESGPGAGDFQIYAPDGHQLAGTELTPLARNWVANFGSIGINTKPGEAGHNFTHLDLFTKDKLRAGQANAWTYPSNAWAPGQKDQVFAAVDSKRWSGGGGPTQLTASAKAAPTDPGAGLSGALPPHYNVAPHQYSQLAQDLLGGIPAGSRTAMLPTMAHPTPPAGVGEGMQSGRGSPSDRLGRAVNPYQPLPMPRPNFGPALATQIPPAPPQFAPGIPLPTLRPMQPGMSAQLGPRVKPNQPLPIMRPNPQPQARPAYAQPYVPQAAGTPLDLSQGPQAAGTPTSGYPSSPFVSADREWDPIAAMRVSQNNRYDQRAAEAFPAPQPPQPAPPRFTMPGNDVANTLPPVGPDFGGDFASAGQMSQFHYSPESSAYPPQQPSVAQQPPWWQNAMDAVLPSQNGIKDAISWLGGGAQAAPALPPPLPRPAPLRDAIDSNNSDLVTGALSIPGRVGDVINDFARPVGEWQANTGPVKAVADTFGYVPNPAGSSDPLGLARIPDTEDLVKSSGWLPPSPPGLPAPYTPDFNATVGSRDAISPDSWHLFNFPSSKPMGSTSIPQDGVQVAGPWQPPAPSQPMTPYSGPGADASYRLATQGKQYGTLGGMPSGLTKSDTMPMPGQMPPAMPSFQAPFVDNLNPAFPDQPQGVPLPTAANPTAPWSPKNDIGAPGADNFSTMPLQQRLSPAMLQAQAAKAVPALISKVLGSAMPGSQIFHALGFANGPGWLGGGQGLSSFPASQRTGTGGSLNLGYGGNAPRTGGGSYSWTASSKDSPVGYYTTPSGTVYQYSRT